MRRFGVTKILLLFLLVASTVAAEDYVDLVDKGNKAYKNGQYKEALEQYHMAETDLPESPELDYNIAGALSQDGGYEESVDKYQKALNSTDINLEEAAHYNLGNTYFRMQDYQKAIESYQKSLEINPDDIDAKYNLELARRMLKEQMKQQQQDQQQQQKQDKKEQQQQKQEEQQQEQQKQQQDQQQEQQNQQDQEKQQQQQQAKQDEKEMSKEDAERILNALRDDEKEIQKKIKRKQSAGDYVGKDW